MVYYIVNFQHLFWLCFLKPSPNTFARFSFNRPLPSVFALETPVALL